ncbi:MAG TPA: hypothetical protein VFQ44_09595 [Streptosporangiaceae bacterium]|nr:hypothetical protein [Streptosporangiaceae bacterium]
MSDSILYLAIVAIWAGFLIPAWVRRPHAARADGESDLAEYEADAEGAGEEQLLVSASAAAYVSAEAETDACAAASPRNSAPHMGAEASVPVHNGNSMYRDDVHSHNYAHPDANAASSGTRAASLDARTGSPDRGHSQSREQMMRARRRMLTILAGLVFITGLFVMAGLVQWWICVPPIAMLVLYVLLLREIAMADAELAAKKRAWEAGQAAKARTEASVGARTEVRTEASAGQRDWKRSHLVWEAEQAEPSAQIIDISSRVKDQLYDQYADAAVRAVGD